VCRLRKITDLLTDAELGDNSAVTLDVLLLKVTEKVTAVTYHLKKTAAAVMVLGVYLKMLCERVDAVSENSDLHLGGACVALVYRIGSDDLLLLILVHCHSFSPL